MNSQKSSNRLRKTLFFYLATALLVLVFSLALTISLTLFDHLKKAEDGRMIHAAQTRAMTIAEWCRRAKDLAWQITSRTRIRQELEKYNQGNISLAVVKAFTEPKLQDAMDLSKDITGILRFGTDNRIIAACGQGSALAKTVQTVDAYGFDDIDLLDPLTIGGRLSIVVSAPIRNRNGVRQGTDLVVLDTDGLGAIVSDGQPSGRTSSVVIGYPSNETIAYLIPPTKSSVEAPARPEMAEAIEAAVVEAIAGQTGIANMADTLLAYVPVDESNWGLVIRQDESELYAPLYRKMANIAVLFLLIYLLILFGFGFVLKPLAGRILLHADDLERKIQEKTADLEQEIVKRTEAEKRVREKEQFLVSVFDSIQDGISVLTPDMKIVRTNRAMQAWYAEHATLEGKACYEVYHDRQKPCHDCPSIRAIASRQLEMQEVPLIQGGTETGVSELYAFPMIDDDGRVTGIVEYVRDVSKQKEYERKLLDLTRKLEMAQQLAKSGWWEYDVRTETIYWPDETYALYGLDPKTTVLDYKRLLECIQPDYRDYHDQQLQVILAQGVAAFQYPIERPDGARRWIWARGETVYDENDAPIKLFGTLQDITDAKRTEEEREQLIAELKAAIAEVRTLSGLLPMCANCKKVRDDRGYWNQLEAYISQHTDAAISHGMCPDCMDDMYSGEDWYEKGKQEGDF